MDTQQGSGPVVVGVDGSESATHAVRWGAAEAARRRTPLRLVTAFAWVVDDVPARPGLEERYRTDLFERAHADLAAAAAEAGRTEPTVPVEQELVVGHPMSVFDGESARAQLVVVGDSGLGRVGEGHVGSLAVALASYAPGPVVVVRGPEPSAAPEAPVLVGVHSAPTSDAAIAFAFEAAAARNAPLLAVHTWWDIVIDLDMAPTPEWDAVEAQEELLLSQRLAVWSDKYPDVPVEAMVVRGRPSRGLLYESARAQLVVVASQSRGGSAGSVLGSAANVVLHRATCPVAVVRPDAAVPA